MDKKQLADIADWPRFNKEYSEHFKTGIKPARITVQSGLGFGIKVEIDAEPGSLTQLVNNI